MKDAAKILEKVDPPYTDVKLAELHDICGVTVVVYYSDETERLYELIESRLRTRSIRKTWGPQLYKSGYYALHAAFRSSRGSQSNLRCELQIKTVLHDAWSAKMHDLTYKPAGAMDSRLGGLMGSVAAQIQGLEEQSQTIRNIITGRHRLENKAFQAYCDAVFGIVFSLGKGDNGLDTDATPDSDARKAARDLDLTSPPLSELWARIEALRASAIATAPDPVAAQEVIDEIDATCAEAPLIRAGWLLITRLASGFLFGDRSRDLVTQVDRLLEYAEANSDPTLTPRVLQAVPMAFYVVGDLQRAAQYTSRLTSGLLEGRLSDFERDGFAFNRLSYLLEHEQLKPMRSASRRERLRLEIEEGLRAPNLREKPAMASAIGDTEGLFKIVFGATPAEVKAGIRECSSAADQATPDERDVAEACRDWRLEAGWRRYFDLSDGAPLSGR